MTEDSGFQVVGNAAELYQKVLVPTWFEPWAHALLAVEPVSPGDRVLDVACGTGAVARQAAQATGSSGHVTGLDINEAMLDIAAALPEPPGAPVTWRIGDAADTGLDDDSFDIVLAQHGYHYFPDKPKALSEFRRVLRSGGRLAMTIWTGHSPYTDALCATLERFVSPAVAAQQRAQRETPAPEALAAAVEAAGFADVTVVQSRLDIRVPPARRFVAQHIGSMPVAAAFDALPERARAAFVAEMEEILAPYAQGDALVYPDAVNVVRGVKRD